MRDPQAVRDFLERDWASAARDKELYWRDYKRTHGPAAGIRVADELRRQVLAARPGWPSEQEREEDLATHRRVIEVLRSIGSSWIAPVPATWAARSCRWSARRTSWR